MASAGGVRLGHGCWPRSAAPARTTCPAPCARRWPGNVLLADADGYQFRHALISEAMHDDLLPGEHSRLHARYAEAISADPDAGARRPRRHRGRPPLVLRARRDLGPDQRLGGRGRGRAGRSPTPSSSTCSAGCSSCGTACPTRPQRIGADHVRVLERGRRGHPPDRRRRPGHRPSPPPPCASSTPSAEPARTALLLERRGVLRCPQDPEVGVADLHRALHLVSDGPHERERGTGPGQPGPPAAQDQPNADAGSPGRRGGAGHRRAAPATSAPRPAR